MTVTPIPHGFDFGQSHAERSPGVHASAIYNDLYQDLEPKRFTRGTAPDPLRLELGLALEEVLEGGLVSRMWERPGEFKTADGVAFSPDGLMFHADGRLIVCETKLTWMSSKDVPREPASGFPPKFDKYMTQLLFYTDGLETPWGRLYVYFVNGLGRGPEFLAWELEFTAREQQENRQMLLNHAKAKGLM